MPIEKAGVAGCGLMGSGIAEVCAKAGADVVVLERDADTIVLEADQEAVDRGRRRVESSLTRATKNGKLDEEQYDRAIARLRYTADMDALGDRELVIEAIVEDETAKAVLFGQLDKAVVNSSAIFASNTSSIPIMKLAMATSRPEQVVGIHFYNPIDQRGNSKPRSQVCARTVRQGGRAISRSSRLCCERFANTLHSVRHPDG